MEYTVSSKQLANMGIPDLPLEAFGGMRPLPRAMVNAGITYHKGGAAKWIAPVVAVAAAIAIPYAAPAIAAAISASSSVAIAATYVATGAVIGAVGGAASAAISGGDIGRGAMFGGFGGAIGGGLSYWAAPASTIDQIRAGATGTVGTTGATGVVGAAAPTTAPATVVPMEQVAYNEFGQAMNVYTGEVLTQTPQGFIAATEGVTSGVGAPSISEALSSSGATARNAAEAAALTGAPESAYAGVNIGGQVAQTAGLSNVPTELAQVTASPAGDVVNGVQTTANAGATAGNVASKAPMTFGEALKQVPSTIAAKFSDPKALADMTLRAAGQLAGSQLAGSGLSPEEQQLLNAQRSELEQLRETNRDLFNQRLQAAQNLIGESKYFDPEYFGLQSQRRVQTAAGLQTQEALRKISPQRAGLRAAEERRARLGATMAGETAYLQGADTAEQNRLRVEQAGINAMPTTAPAGSLQYGQYLGGLYDVGYNRRNKEAAGIGSFIGGLTGTNKAGSLFG